MKNRLSLIVLLLFAGIAVHAQSSTAYWSELEFSKKIIKNLKFEFNPELRLLDKFKMDSYILEGGMSFKAHKYLTVAGYYRYEQEWDYKKSGDYKGKNSLNRFAFDLKSGYELFRFNFQARIRYTKGLDSDNNASEMRYRAKIDYNIKGVKLLPFVSVELFNDKSLTDFDRSNIAGGFKDIDKIRYTGGLTYDINNDNSVSAFYRIQDNRVKDETVNILGLSFSHDF